MGKGDKKTRRGKIHIGSYGARRQKKKRIPAVFVKSAPKVKAVVEEEVVPVVTGTEVKEPKKPVKKAEKAEKPKAEKKPAAKKSAKKTETPVEPTEIKPEEPPVAE